MNESLPSLGPYEPLERIGEGGMGEVWVARQSEPLERIVAVKIIKAGMDSRRVLARFETERQSLARMDHPHIARVYDAGLTAEGRPYFAMEFVRGVPITDYCDRHQLDARARLELMLPVCEAVQHAHQRGVIHRDLKPSNVLVEVREGRPVPKVIDFGVAKSTTSDLDDGPMVTEVGQLVGTPEYMSPEQADLSGVQPDSRTDIYSLGVLLYELLTGVLPFESRELRKGGISEIRRVLRDVEPQRPSTRIPAPDGAEVARRRATTPSALRRRLQGDLDWIVLRALEKDRDRRYPSASELGEDLRRHLRDEPVLAGPPSARYRLRKFVRRHRAGVITVATAGVLILAGLATTGWQAVRAGKAEKEARRQAATASAVSEFLKGMLREVDPTENPSGRTVTMMEVLDRAAADLEGAFVESPDVEAELRATLGSAYAQLGRPDDAERQYAGALAQAQAPESRLPILTGAITSDLIVSRVDSAELRALEALDLTATRAGTDPARVGAIADLARVRLRQERYLEADSLFSDALGRAEDLPSESDGNVMTWSHDHGLTLGQLGRYEAAIARIETAADWFEEHDGEFDPNAARTRSNLGALLVQTGELDRAEVELLRGLRGLEGGMGRNVSYATAVSSLAKIHELRGEYAVADSMLRVSCGIVRSILGAESQPYAKQLSHLGAVRRYAGDLDGAEQVFEEALAINRALFGDDPRLLEATNNLAAVRRSQGNYEEAERLFREALRYTIEQRGRNHARTAIVTQNLAGTITDAGRPDEGEPLYREALEIAEGALPAGHPNIAIIRGNHGECLLRAGRPGEARSELEQAWEGITAKLGEGHPRARRVAGWLVEACTALGDPEGAARWRARAAEESP